MPYNEVMPKFGKGKLHSGSKKGKLVKNRKQAVAIMLSEKKQADEGDSEYQESPVGPSKGAFKEMMHKKPSKKPLFGKKK